MKNNDCKDTESTQPKMIAIAHPASSDCLAAISSYPPASSPVPPVVIRYWRFAQDKPARQLLVFECAPSFSGALQGKGMALVELADGRVFFFRTSLAAMRDRPDVNGDIKPRKYGGAIFSGTENAAGCR